VSEILTIRNLPTNLNVGISGIISHEFDETEKILNYMPVEVLHEAFNDTNET